MRKRRWIETEQGNHPIKHNARMCVAIQDIMKHAIGPVTVVNVGKNGAVQAPTYASAAQNPYIPSFVEWTSSVAKNNDILDNSTALFFWLDHSYFDPQEVEQLFKKDKISKIDYTARDLKGAFGYSHTAIREDFQTFVSAISSQVYHKSGRTVHLPLRADWIIATGNNSELHPPIGLLLLAPREYADILKTDVVSLLKQPSLERYAVQRNSDRRER